jgi:hypothetical protein
VVTVAAVVIASQLPHLKSPIDRLIKVHAEAGTPSYLPPIDDAPFRVAGRIIPDDSRTTFIVEAPTAYHLDFTGASYLYLLPAIPTTDPRNAEWILAYRAAPEVPAASRVLRRYRIDANTTLLHVAPS